MARVTKINVGGTNYDIAHEGALKNSGFEVVSSLPTTGLFEGREVLYQGKKYVYSTFSRTWVIAFDSKKQPLYNVIDSRGYYEILGYDYSLYDNTISRSYLSKYDNYCKHTNDFLIETSVDNETFIAIDRADKAYQIFNATNTYNWRVSSYKSLRLTFGSSEVAINILSFYINHVLLKVNKIKIDQLLKSDLSWEVFGEVDFTAVNPRNYAVFFSVDMFSKKLGRYGLIDKIRFTIEFDALSSTNSSISNVFLICDGNKYLAGINNYFNLSYKLLDCYSTIDYPITLNYDVANIEPTQTGEVEKKANWVLRYLLQGVNWLKANKVALSVYNAKVAELMQADSDNNTHIQSVKEELRALNGGLADVATSGDYNDLLNRPTLVFQNIGGTISSVQIPDGSIANSKLANSSMTLNGINVSLGDTAILPWKVEIDGTTYSARLWNNWLWIYNGGWIKKFYLLSQEPIQPTNVTQITSLSDLSWYDERVSEYEIDSNTTFELLNGKVFIASQLIDCSANQLTLNLYPIIAKDYVKGSLDNVISDLKDNNFAVFVENDIDTILTSGSNFCVRIKISKVPTPKAIIECYVAK